MGREDENDAFSGVSIPYNAEIDSTMGFAFVEYESAESVTKALEALQGYAFDKSHSLKILSYDRAVQLLSQKEDEEYKEPEPVPFVEKVNTSSWLLDNFQRDQFVIRQGRETVVYWSDSRLDPVVDYDGSREKEAGVAWCEYYVQWSPLGSYLATLVPARGVILWGGSSYEKLARFPAAGVETVLFSPRENYILISNNRRDDPAAIKVFSIESGKLLRTFPLFPSKFLPEKATKEEIQQITPPPFQWSHDDKYLARMGVDMISIYETPSMKLLDQTSLITDGIREFQFSPRANILAYWAPEHGNAPAHVDIIELPSRNKLRQKNLFNVNKCSMVWQSEGAFLGVKVTRHTKSKKTFFNNLELFRVQEPGIPVEMLDIKDAVMAFAWEPKGSRFAIIHAENPSSTKVNVSFYDMNKVVEVPPPLTSKSKKIEMTVVAEVNKVETLEGKQCNCFFWSPAGKNIVLASLGEAASGTLEFYDVETKALVVKEHYRANQVLWDPSGRTVATTVTQPISGGQFKFAMDNGYILWSFYGKQLCTQSFETFYQLQWRPRETLLSKEETAVVIKNLKKYEKQFDKADKELSRARYLEETKGKRALRTAFRQHIAHLRAIKNNQHADRVVLLGGYDSEDESNYVMKEITVESVLTVKEEVV